MGTECIRMSADDFTHDSGSFTLTDRDTLESGTVDLSKICGVVQGKSDDHSQEAVRIRCMYVERIVRCKEYNQ